MRPQDHFREAQSRRQEMEVINLRLLVYFIYT
jgi:hypothetical protein